MTFILINGNTIMIKHYKLYASPSGGHPTKRVNSRHRPLAPRAGPAGHQADPHGHLQAAERRAEDLDQDSEREDDETS